MRLSAVLLSGLVLLAAGCASVQPTTSQSVREARFESREAELQALAGWHLYARAAINTPRQSGTVSLFWRQSPVQYTLTLRAALGAGTVQLRGDGQRVRLRTSDGRRDSASDAAVLIERHTGYVLPVEKLRYWVLGLPSPEGGRELELNGQGEVTQLHQAGWTLHYEDYRDVDGLRLPGTIRARGQGVELKLAVQQWDIRREAG